ncbi:ATP-binding cassette domain-containing protein [Microbacterium esteraromaticum]|uniref:ABC transporter ATP-binding protein n=1 Tax=Microbacterium esteraromaticum TaxID=57043 RepID=UPI001CD5477B|nr:ABC transporter ATP-binding protein [Microbacterium esteraromaticum]MCA1307051.1 ATP-binding cassette domain-containing protein [Microbacterium esteraromaticum]
MTRRRERPAVPASDPLLRVRDLSVTHAGSAHPSPRNVSFDVHPGEVVLVLGPSGSGKSTLTLTLNGLIPQSVTAEVAGRVETAGMDARATPVAELSRHISMVFQDPDSQLVTGTVLDEVAFGLENLLLPVDEVLTRSEQALRRMGLWHKRSWNPDLLSGGGRQRLAIACALAMRSRVIVLDEPTANLDPQGIDDVYDALGELAHDADRAIVLVEHNLDAAMRFATRAVVLDHDSGVVLDGPARDTIRNNADALLELGVWLPSSTLAALRLRAAGADIPVLPVTPDEFAHLPADLFPAPAQIPLADAPSAITVRDMTVLKRREPVLMVPQLQIPEGSFTAIVGANGAGKTTLLQALAGVVPAPRRTVMIGDLDAGRAAPRQLASRVGFVFQNPEHQFIAGTVREELAHGLRMQRLPATEIDERVDGMLARFGLMHKADVHPFLLSGGEKRRLSVGTALIARPGVLALDEPTFGQDRARATELLTLLKELQAEGTTVLIVTHDLQLVAEYSTHTVMLRDGALHAAGRTADLFADPTVFAAAGLRLPPMLRVLAERRAV